MTGLSFDAAVDLLVFRALGMHGATFHPVAEIPYWHTTFPAFGALNAPPAAMARFLEALPNGGLLREAGRGYVVGINVDDPGLLSRMQRLIESALTAGLAPPPERPAVAIAAAELSGYTGTYYPSSSRFAVERWRAGKAQTAEVRSAGDGLVFSLGGRHIRLVPLGHGRFRRNGDPAVSAVFAEHAGALHLQGELGNFVRVTRGDCPVYLRFCATP